MPMTTAQKNKAVLAVFEKYERAQEELASIMSRASGVKSSWNTHKEFEGFSKDGEVIRYDASNAEAIMNSYRRSVDTAKKEVEEWRAVLITMMAVD